MSPALVICTIIFYIISLIAAFLLAISSKKLKSINFKFVLVFHCILIIIAILSNLVFSDTIFQKYATLVAFCSGLAISGWALRDIASPALLKFYFLIYLISVIIFIYSPSSLFYLISGSLKYYRGAQEYKLKENYYLVEQQSMLNLTSSKIKYKVIKKYGIYNKSIARDVTFTGKIDSVKLLKLTDDTILLRSYQQLSDSIDIGLKPGTLQNTISHKNQN